jgi:hypothetical protein
MVTLQAVNRWLGAKIKNPRNLLFLGLVYSPISWGNQVGMVPELAARQAQGIIMRRAPVVKLDWTFQFGTIFASFCSFFRSGDSI